MIGPVRPAQRIYLCLEPTDMRKSFDGLAALVQEVLEQDLFSGAWFVFRNRRGDRLKGLWWDGTGYCVFYKRLEEGTFPCRAWTGDDSAPGERAGAAARGTGLASFAAAHW